MKLHTTWSAAGFTLVVDERGRQVALPPSLVDFRAEEWEALAPKIAAADDMLATLRKARDVLEMVDALEMGLSDGTDKSIKDVIDAVIAKATPTGMTAPKIAAIQKQEKREEWLRRAAELGMQQLIWASASRMSKDMQSACCKAAQAIADTLAKYPRTTPAEGQKP